MHRRVDSLCCCNSCHDVENYCVMILSYIKRDTVLLRSQCLQLSLVAFPIAIVVEFDVKLIKLMLQGHHLGHAIYI
jgi:hypothetical protein